MYPSMNTTELGNSTKNKFADFSDTEDFHGGGGGAVGDGAIAAAPTNMDGGQT